MMNPDLRICIAYGNARTKKIGETIAQKLGAWDKDGYPVTVGFIDKKRDEFVTEYRLKKGIGDGGDSSIPLAEFMERAFMDFDCAIFLFDHRKLVVHQKDGEIVRDVEIFDEEHEDSKRKLDLLSGNLLFEYGMATTVFHNRKIGKRNSKDSDKIVSLGSPVISFAFSPLNKDLYAFRLNPIELFTKNNGEDYMEKSEEDCVEIILEYIHTHFVVPSFYGIPTNWKELK